MKKYLTILGSLIALNSQANQATTVVITTAQPIQTHTWLAAPAQRLTTPALLANSSPSDAEINEQIKEVLVQLGADGSQISPEASFKDDLGMDSLDSVELVMALEEKFNINIADDTMCQLTTVDALTNYIKQKRK